MDLPDTSLRQSFLGDLLPLLPGIPAETLTQGSGLGSAMAALLRADMRPPAFTVSGPFFQPQTQ